jgi:cellulose synthase/poly-beta-1,6-N-acetylglucosamine synthase-like glycosyltransferase
MTVVLALSFAFYTYVGYPLIVAVVAALRRPARQTQPTEWPRISITVPAYNEEREIGATLEALLELDYPADRREILVVSDASTDRTDEIVRTFADRGVTLVRMDKRRGKTAAENAVSLHLTGDIVVNTDASIRIAPTALKPLIAAFADATVGVASGRDVSVARGQSGGNAGESRYVGYEMLVRALETRAGGIIGASGCLYAIRANLHRIKLPEGLSRDFAAALNARRHGYRAVSVDEAVCYVPRTRSLRNEYSRKVRTMTRGMQTLFAMRSILNPLRFGLFAWMLWSHKVCRWLVPWAAAACFGALLALAVSSPLAGYVAMAGGVVLLLGATGFALAERRDLPALLAFPAYAVMGNVAAMQAAVRALYGRKNAVWEPTRRDMALGRQAV